jgi:hypothetical protein
MDFALSGFIFSSLRGFTPCLLRENYHGFCPQCLCIFIPQRIYTVSPQRELSWILPLMAFHFHPPVDTVSPRRELSRILPSVALHFHPSEDLYHVSSKRTIIDFALSGFVFSSLREFTPCLLRENYHEFFPQWPFIFIPQWIPCLLKENYHEFCPQWIYIFIPRRTYTMSPSRGLSRILHSVALHFHPSEDLHRVSSKRNITDFALSGLSFSSLRGLISCLIRENFRGF